MEKRHHCRLCGVRLVVGFNYDTALLKSYVCVNCLLVRTCEFERNSNRRIGRDWKRLTMARLAIDYTRAQEPLGAGQKKWEPRLLPPMSFLQACMEAELQALVQLAISLHIPRVKCVEEFLSSI